MSRKPTKKPDSDDLDPQDLQARDDDDSEDHQESENMDVAQVASASDESDDDFEEEEFSLDQLTQAYAEVLKAQSGSEDDVDPSDDPNELDDIEDEKSEKPAVNDNAGCPISPESIIESILFVGAPQDVKLNSRKVAAVLRDVSPKEVTKIVRELNARYEKEDAAYRVESDGGVFKMILDPKLTDFQQDFFGRNRQVRLSQAAIDVMAIVAYNQPVTREQVEKIRAKPSGSVLAQLVRRQLVFVEPGETNPKIKYYSTTDRFLDLFQLEEIADLPQSHDVSDMDELAD